MPRQSYYLPQGRIDVDDLADILDEMSGRIEVRDAQLVLSIAWPDDTSRIDWSSLLSVIEDRAKLRDVVLKRVGI